MLTVAIGDVLSGLANAMYELPKKAVSFATLDELLSKGYESCRESSVNKARGLLNQVSREINIDTQMMDDKTLQGYATKYGYDSAESYLNLKDYVLNCGGSLSNIPTQLSEKAQKMVNHAIEYAQANGKEIPFFGSAEADLVVALTGLAIGGSVALYKWASKIGGSKLFPDYSKT